MKIDFRGAASCRTRFALSLAALRSDCRPNTLFTRRRRSASGVNSRRSASGVNSRCRSLCSALIIMGKFIHAVFNILKDHINKLHQKTDTVKKHRVCFWKCSGRKLFIIPDRQAYRKGICHRLKAQQYLFLPSRLYRIPKAVL